MQGYGSVVVNGQLVPTRTMEALWPVSYGPTIQQIPGNLGAVPSVPPGIGTGNAYGAGDTMFAAQAAADPFNFRTSPVLFSVIALVAGLLILRVVHWRAAG